VGQSPVRPTKAGEIVEPAAAGGVTAASGATSTWSPISFVIPAGSCPLLPSTVTGSGESHLRVRATDLGDGTLRLSLTNNVHGTADDGAGNQYVFDYTNTVHGITSAIEPIPPFDVQVTDHFNLVGAGRAPRVHVGFLLHIAVDAGGNVTAFDIKQRGPEGCDPI